MIRKATSSRRRQISSLKLYQLMMIVIELNSFMKLRTKRTEPERPPTLEKPRTVRGVARAPWCGSKALLMRLSTKATGNKTKQKVMALSAVDLDDGSLKENSRTTRKKRASLFR